MHDVITVVQVSFTFFFSLGMDGFSIVVADAREPAGQGTAAAAERMFVSDTPTVNTAVADYSPVGNAMTASSQAIWLAMSVIATQLR
jgi:hypothetical protein